MTEVQKTIAQQRFSLCSNLSNNRLSSYSGSSFSESEHIYVEYSNDKSLTNAIEHDENTYFDDKNFNFNNQFQRNSISAIPITTMRGNSRSVRNSVVGIGGSGSVRSSVVSMGGSGSIRNSVFSMRESIYPSGSNSNSDSKEDDESDE
eukprot:Pgem_evm1s19359